MSEPLVIIHLSSLDSYADLEYEATESRDNAYALAFRMAERVLKHQGPVIIVDQGWLFIGRESRPRSRFIDEVGLPDEDYQTFQSDVDELGVKEQRGPDRDILWLKFDEQYTPWEDFFKVLDQVLQDLDAKKVILGGLFYDDEGGCVTATYNHLKAIGMPVEAALDAVGGCGEYFEPGEDLPGGYTR